MGTPFPVSVRFGASPQAFVIDAVLRTMRAADILGIRGLLVHAISDAAKLFYEHHGFVASARLPMTLVLSLKRAG